MTGTGGDPARLLEGVTWQAEDVGGMGLPDGAQVTLTFRGGQVAGDSGCNRFGGGYALTGEGLSLGAIAATRRACVPALMDLERKVFSALEGVTRFDIDETGALVLIAGDTPVMRLRS